MIGSVFASLFTWESLLFLNIGLAAGIMVGALPGLTSAIGVALLLPLTYGLDSVTGVLLLLGAYCGAVYGGSITAILIKTPGTPAAAATLLDGHTLAQKGHAGLALDSALKASTFGGVFSALLLLFVAPLLAKLALQFGPAEYFSLAVFGLTIISGISGKSLGKGLLMGIVGLLFTTVGVDRISGNARFTFGVNALWGGITMIPAMVGLFAVSELLVKMKAGREARSTAMQYQKESLSIKKFFSYSNTLVKSSLIGSFVGAVPGTGASIAAFMSYNEAKRCSKTPELFGTGHIDGIMAPESANNAVTGSAMIPLLTLGIPGDTVTAIMVGALMMQGIVPGPQLFVEQKHWVYSIMVGLLIVNIFMFLQGKLFIKAFVQVTRVSQQILIPILLVLCVIGAYAGNNTVVDIVIMVGFGIVGYFLRKFEFPLTPMVIALVLGPLAEENLRRALILSDGSFGTFIARPISALFLLIALFTIAWPFLKKYLEWRRAVKQA
ncbi:MAG: C4-dicarboxylate ABC transporter permease [Ruminococcaceae bacterium]|nr:C4-dicarboxylate ABC transporter permease [Oscillospiraceae bacterium]